MTRLPVRFSLLLAAACWMLALPAATLGTEQGEPYVKQATWVETMLATRASLVEPAEEGEREIEFSPWHTTGQLKCERFDEALFPEQGVDLAAKGQDGKPLWTEKPDLDDGCVHNLESHGGRGPTYLFRTITVKQPTTIRAGFGSDDGLAVWLDGEKLISNDVSRGVVPNSDFAELKLKPGENRLLLKIYNTGGGHGFCFSVGAEPVDPLPELWEKLKGDFPLETGWMERHLGRDRCHAWFRAGGDIELERELIERAMRDCGREGEQFRGAFEELGRAEVPADDPRWLDLYRRVCLFRHRPAELRQVNVRALRLAVEDLVQSFGGRYRRGQEYLKRLDDFDRQVGQIELALAGGDRGAKNRVKPLVDQFERLRKEALLDNPLLDFDKLLLVKRGAGSPKLGLPQNWQGNCALPKTGYDNEIAVLTPVRPEGRLTTLFKPEKGEFVGDVDLNFDADKMLFSMPGDFGRFQIWEIGVDGRGLRQVTPGDYNDVDNYDACYLPDGRIIFDSTRCFQGIPCVGGGNTVANLCLMNPDGSAIRQLCFDQDHNWCPTVLNSGRVLFSRWEYSDTPHYFTRLVFSMNPDGTDQKEYYASNSPWPNSTFYARPIPGDPAKVIGVISGHHGVPRMGELILFDPAQGRRMAQGAVQRIPGYGVEVEAKIGDGIVNGSWPKFLHPYPLSDKYFLVSMQRDNSSLWGIYLVDVFDNMVLVKEQPGYVLFEPVPLRKTPRPPVIPEKVDLSKDYATVYMQDVYLGPGLQGVPRGVVKALRIYEPHYAYPGMGGHINIGIDGPWDARRIHGTVPVEKDGSAYFRVPANTPLAVQPLDEKGRALQVMRSWFTAMPGEVLSCTGCHESQNSVPPAKLTMAMHGKPHQITPWRGPARPFSFKREVQPVLDKYCVGCHDGEHGDRPDFRVDGPNRFRNFTPSYCALHPYVRRPGPESDYFLQRPLEFHASTSELVQMLEKGHHHVQLDDEAWDRLVTWIDLNVPDHGTWTEHRGNSERSASRRLEMRTTYANRPENPEVYPSDPPGPVAFVEPKPEPERRAQNLRVAGWPFDAGEAKRRQQEAAERLGVEPSVSLELAEGVTMDLVLIPAGEFVMGRHDAAVDEYPAAVAKIERPFYLGVCEVTNRQYAAFDPEHDSAYISMTNKDQSSRGHAVNGPEQPVVRITWEQAMEFCAWLSRTGGQRFTLPTEAQWEWACRAGTATPFWFGPEDADFSRFANLADRQLENFAKRDSPKWHPKDLRFDDRAMVTTNVGRYEPNPWGLKDMLGNAAEWTLSTYRPYPYDPRDGREHARAQGAKTVRGGSWYDRPQRARSGFRGHYEPWQRVYNVGFRVVMEVK